MQILNNFIAISRTCFKNNLILINARNFSAAAKYHETKEISQQEQPKKDHEAEEEVEGHQRALHIAVIGVPNAGKSTFINNLINHRVCPTSSKVHTTRKANTAICTTGDTQLVFYDTPGLVTQREIKKHHLEQSFKSSYRHAVQHADIIAVMQDVTNAWTRKELHSTVIDTLKAYPNLPSFLILNKIDALKSKRLLLDLIGTLTNNTLSGRSDGRRHRQKKSKKETSAIDKTSDEDSSADGEANVLEFNDLHKREVSWNNFSDVFMVSSITGSGLNDIQDYLVNNAKERSWKYPAETFTDESPESLIVDSVRARLLDYLPQEIPYNLKSVIEYYSEENNTIYASVQVICPTARIERLICGESNGKLRQITERVTSDLVETFGKPISLTIATISKKEKD